MRFQNSPMTKRNERGQTLVIALIVLGVLLVLGLVLLGIVNRNIRTAGRMQQRSEATDLAEAGIRYAHSQLLNSELGADWRGAAGTAPANVRDPDAVYLNGGGPDGLGAYTRVNFRNGRSLIRVRYGPTDANVFQGNAQGPLRDPGRARNYLIIESVGRPGLVNLNDPTILANRDRREERKMIAFASIGIIEHARFIHNKYQVTRAAEVGVPQQIGVSYLGQPVLVPMQLGDQMTVPTLNGVGTATVGIGGSLWSNADIQLHGQVVTYLNYSMGDMWNIAGTLIAGESSAALQINRSAWNRTSSAWQNTTTVLNSGQIDSRQDSFTTVGGTIRDGFRGFDAELYARGASFKAPPSMMRTDPDTGVNRYITLTRSSGPIINTGNSGRFGHGRGIYVNNLDDKQLRSDEDGREDLGTAESLFNDWLNPNNPSGNWKGPFYTPPGAFVQMFRDGFLIVRDARAAPSRRTWRRPDGSDTQRSTIRYRIGNVNGRPYIVNTFTPGVDINAGTIDYSLGQPFNGILFFEGNVRVRGVIPTDIQMSIVSNATVYVEGSITKGAQNPDGSPLNRPSRSMLILMAKDYVALNTSQFFGPAMSDVEEANESASAVQWNPIRVLAAQPGIGTGGLLNLRAEFLLDPTTGANAANWTPFLTNYVSSGPGNESITPSMLISHTMEDGAAPNSFVSLDVNYGAGGQPNYLFALTPSNAATSIVGPAYTTPGYTAAGYGPWYGLGAEPWQRYGKFETIGFPLLDLAGATRNGATIQANGTSGNYQLLLQDTNDFLFRTTALGQNATNNYYLARAAIAPHDVRVEASMFAEEGSFFVIPGNWFNPDPNDNRQAYESAVANYQTTGLSLTQAVAAANRDRLDSFGSFPEMPFYGEPVDVRVTMVGSLSENMPPPIGQQAEWIRKWGWIPRELGARRATDGSALQVPVQHIPAGYTVNDQTPYVPNLTLVQDPALITGRTGMNDPYIRTDADGRPLPPIPRLPVSPTLAYFGEVNP